MPESVVGDVIAAAGDDARLGGRRMYATVLFCDLRGFTARAEGLPPEFVIELLNRYLTEMSDAVLDNGGTLVSSRATGSWPCSARRWSSRTTPTGRSPPPARSSASACPR